MRFSFILAVLAVAFAEIIPIESIDQFYDLANKDGTYTVVKYYTEWCSHCKKLKSVYKELDEQLSSESNLNAPIQFVEVDCDTYGSTICKRLPGYPIVEVVKPPTLDANTTVTDTPTLFERVKRAIFGENTWTISDDRIVRFEGSRSVNPLQGFITMVVNKDVMKRQLMDIIEGRPIEAQDKVLNAIKEYYNELEHNNLVHERARLERILKTNDDGQLDIVKGQLELINLLETTNEIVDEL
ncbi:hypothetical protein B1J92_I07777g [Nakaseomyces glabratus]|nr:Thioredoxin [Nakaseomyces glabratus]KAH7598672.1 Thioredoxin [Nakaseomyces glabratus]KAH7612945.1 Thioredoxin [Nakaseomyces glabratus]OXB42528.1 hypothetical protein B1J91_I07777g [Nakaseomyces glabratus]OXB47827.1 hypothetical protein B1J92_I07777g [Nakaseomyces glabratus]